MKKLLFLALLSVMACKTDKSADTSNDKKMENTPEIAYASFGEKISDIDALSSAELMTKYKSLKEGDTLNIKAEGKILEVCSVKGCWMKLDMGNDEMVRVTFKDYGFFMPLNANGDVVINGKAYVSETSVEELKHYAEDAGKTKEEVEAITQPEFTYSFVADGVLLKK